MSTPLFLNQAEASDMESSQYDSGADSPGSLNDFIDNDDINMADAVSSDVPPIIGQKRSRDNVDDDLYAAPPPTKKIFQNLPSVDRVITETTTSIPEIIETGPTMSTIMEPHQDAAIQDNMLGEEVDPQEFETDENGNPIYQKKKNGEPRLDKAGNPIPKKKAFEKQVRCYFLTYPNCNLTTDEFLMLSREYNHGPDRFIACRERHKKTEQFHFHIILDLGVNSNGKPPKIKSCRAFDIGGKKNGRKDYPNYHPNIQTVRNLDNSWHYINKMDYNGYLKEDGEEIFGDMKDPCLKGEAKMHKNNGWHHALAAETKQEFMDIIAKINPEKFILQNDALESFAEKRYGDSSTRTMEEDVRESNSQRSTSTVMVKWTPRDQKDELRKILG